MAFADVVSTSSDQRLGEIRLAWWRERLEDLDAGKGTSAEPRLSAAASRLLPLGLTGRELARLEDAWLPLLEPFPWSAPQTRGLRLRGKILFGIGGRLLGDDSDTTLAAGELWSLIDGALHCSDEPSRRFLLDEASSIEISERARRQLRPLTILAAIAVSDARAPSSGVARGVAAAYHRLTGRFPRRLRTAGSALGQSDVT